MSLDEMLHYFFHQCIQSLHVTRASALMVFNCLLCIGVILLNKFNSIQVNVICLRITDPQQRYGLGIVVRAKGTLANTILHGKVTGKDHEEDQQDSGWTTKRNRQGKLG